MSTAQTTQLENAHAFLSHLNALNFDALADLLAPNFTHEYFPASLTLPGGKAKRGKEEMLELFKHAWLTVFEFITVCLLAKECTRNVDPQVGFFPVAETN
jgi:hypothetical protein